MAESSEAAASSGAAAKPQQKTVGLSIDRSDKVPTKIAGPFADFADPESGFNKLFMNPIMKELEATVAKNNATLDRMTRQMDVDREKTIKDKQTSHIPEALKGGGQKLEDVMQHLEEMITYQSGDKSGPPAELQPLDEHGQAVLTTHSVAAFVSTLQEAHLKTFATNINNDCQLWLSRLFRFNDSQVVYHEEERDGLVKICRLALHQKYPNYGTDGFDALYSRPPVIYISAAAKPGLGHYICLQLGLPLSCICTVPCNTMFGASSKMDVAMLEKLIQDDIAAAKTPVLLVGYAGTPIVGHVDNLGRLQEICKKNSIWLHVEGNNLSTLTLLSVPTAVESAISGDSMTLDLQRWLGIPGLPYFTLFKTSDPALVHAAGLNTFNPRLKLSCLPLWVCLQSIGHDGIVERIKTSIDLAKTLADELGQITTMRLVSHDKKETARRGNSIMDLISKAISAFLMFEIATPTVVFRYAEDVAGAGMMVAPYARAEMEEDSTMPSYYDSLNNWLAETLQRACPKLPIEAVEVEKEGICLRYSPLDSAPAKGTTKEDVLAFVEALTKQLSVLDATVLMRPRFLNVVKSHPNLVLVQHDSWAGLGAVRYIPEAWLDKLDDLPAKGKQDINGLNTEVVHKLKAMDTAFSSGHGEDGLICVRFGLVTKDTDVEELVKMVHSIGKEVEESSKYLERISEMIQKGIHAANDELSKENESRVQQEGVLRLLPVVGSLVNWWSPVKENVKGRTFDLSSGRVMTTDQVYKYHMQLQESGRQAAAAASKPQSTPTTHGATPTTPSPTPATPPPTPEGAGSKGATPGEGASKVPAKAGGAPAGSVPSPQSPAPPASPGGQAKPPDSQSAGEVKARLASEVGQSPPTTPTPAPASSPTPASGQAKAAVPEAAQ